MSPRLSHSLRRLMGFSVAVVILVGLSACATESLQPAPAPQVNSFQEMLMAHARCLQDHGWLDAGYDEMSNLTVSVPQSQADQFTRDSSECKQEVEFKQVESSVSLSTESLSRLYEFEMDTAQCLLKDGYDVGQPPSRQSFIDAYQSGGTAWIAYGQLPELSEIEFKALSERCPQAAFAYGNELWDELYGQ